MTPQEAQMLQDLVRKIQQTQLTEKDPDAEALLMDGLARDPDALYKLAQTVLIQNLALNQARQQIEQPRQHYPAFGEIDDPSAAKPTRVRASKQDKSKEAAAEPATDEVPAPLFALYSDGDFLIMRDDIQPPAMLPRSDTT